jgi:Protein of unknown function (DUF2442)
MPEPAKVVTTDAEIDAAIRQARVYEKYDRRVLRATYSERTDRFMLYMDNGVTLIVPRRLLQGLADAEPGALHEIELLGKGTGLYWPAQDVAHSVSGLLAGVYGSAKWMEHLHIGPKARRTAVTPRSSNGSRRGRVLRTNEKKGSTSVRALRAAYGDTFLPEWHGNAKLSTVRDETDMSLTELVRQHRRGKA